MRTPPPWVALARAAWTWRGAARPDFAVSPGPGQESVWDYPRPPIVVADARHVIVRDGDVVVADSRRAMRLLETSHPPTWYLPRADVEPTRIRPAGRAGSFCEWKGQATYLDVLGDARVLGAAAWTYEDPIDDAFAELRGAVAFYATELQCTVDGERVRPQPGGFYGGWITSELVGPWKGEAGTGGW